MKSTLVRSLMFGGLLFSASCTKERDASHSTNNGTEAQPNGVAAAASDPVASAESAAPASIAHNASIVTVAAGGAMTTLRKGSNGWTCMPDAPDTPGPDPMCFDKSAANWVAAWVGHKAPPPGTVGLMYMLEGGTDASNTDPYANAPTGGGDWIKTGPHIMIVGSSDILKGHPSGGRIDTSAPYVMWAGTPYAHLMVPVEAGA